jgi:hypothetical protein
MNTLAATRITYRSSSQPSTVHNRTLRYASSLLSRIGWSTTYSPCGLSRISNALSMISRFYRICPCDRYCIQNESDARSFLAYCCTRLAFLSHDALSDPRATLRLHKEVAMLDTVNPSAEAYDGIGMSIEACLGGDRREALSIIENKTNKSVQEEDNVMGDEYTVPISIIITIIIIMGWMIIQVL